MDTARSSGCGPRAGGAGSAGMEDSHHGQSRGTKTYVYNWTSSGWSTLWISTAPSSSSYVGNSKNDKADSLTVC
ncbi:hypothetical protein GCM10010400_26820 [Streptomyces aculeolatus]